ncbi:MAG: hypothetical protein A3E87_01170 [Gammaproteobacteria bacterium RIFCSPHIGHO2_12_FULL_35_23]|nr:MAG: hypothetical protein A3E87_01170 [Gammaproteobacteria bacterium RIFCSPHIGHO2_12_FULL_35_23]
MILPKLIAHRGASAYAPENTLSAMHKAKQIGAEWVEFDVQLTADFEAVVFHDDEIDRTTNGSGPVIDKTLAELRQLDAGSWFAPTFTGEKIATLAEIVDCLREEALLMNVEIKPGPSQTDQLILAIDAVLKIHWPAGLASPLLSSFNWNYLYLIKNLKLGYPLAILMHEWQEDWLDHAKALNCVSVNVNENLLTLERVSLIKQAGFGLLAYTVNTVSRAQQLYEWGVDGLFTDYIDLLKPVVNAQKMISSKTG